MADFAVNQQRMKDAILKYFKAAINNAVEAACASGKFETQISVEDELPSELMKKLNEIYPHLYFLNSGANPPLNAKPSLKVYWRCIYD